MYLPPVPTGRLIVSFKSEAEPSDVSSTVANAINDASLRAGKPENPEAEHLIDEFGIGVVEGGSEQAKLLQQEECVQSVRPEFYLFAYGGEEERWVRETLYTLGDNIIDRLIRRPEKDAQQAADAIRDTPELTWGVRAVGADLSKYTGAGIRVGVLDTGIDLQHPDFANHQIVSKSFCGTETAQDGTGHGTHVAGTIAGPVRPTQGRRYGVAPDVDLCIGKVLDDSGSGREFDVISGISWAIKQGCHIISMSLGRSVRAGEKWDPLYEKVARVAIDNGCLIIAAAGNDSNRGYGHIAPVGSPANAPHVVAVGSVDSRLGVSGFSCGGLTSGGGEVNIVGPGEGVISSWPMPRRLNSISGTSMATPHVAGVAALVAQSDASMRGMALWDNMKRRCQRLGVGRDYGYGLAKP